MHDVHDYRESIAKVAQLLRACRSLLFVTGAGISAESGLPTYRGIGGLYDVDTTAEGLPIEEILSGEMLRASPALTWKYLMQIGLACHGKTFNRAHAVLAEMERTFERVCVVTQNVDGFHHAAGSRNVIDLHGDLHKLICTQCDFSTLIDAGDEHALTIPPSCPRCNALLRPDVVLFGESLPVEKTERLYRELSTGFDLVFSIGTSSLFHYITWPIELARDQGNPTVEINLQTTAISDRVDIHLPLAASIALDAIWVQFLSNGIGSNGIVA